MSCPREWEPALKSTVVDARRDTEGAKGIVLECARYGHLADPYWRATVRWEGGGTSVVETSWLTREDGTQ